MQKIIKIGPIVSEKNYRTHTHTHGHTHRQGANYRPIFVPKDRSKKVKKKYEMFSLQDSYFFFYNFFFLCAQQKWILTLQQNLGILDTDIIRVNKRFCRDLEKKFKCF